MGCGQSGRSGLGFPETERCVGVVPWVGRGGLWEHLESVTGFDSGKQPCAWKEGSAVPSDHQPHPVSFSASEQDLPRKVLSGLKIGVYVTNDREQIIAVNPRGEKLLGRSESAMIGRNAHDLLHRAEGGALLPRSQCPLMKAFLQGQSVYGGNKWFLRGDGALLPVIWLTAPYRINRDTTGALVLFHPRDPRGDPSSEEVPVDQVTMLTDLADSLSLIAEVTSVLTSTLQVREALWLLARQVTPRLADWVVIDLLNEIGELERALVVHHENGRHIRREEMQGPLPPVSETSLMPLSRVLRGASTTRVSLRDYQRPPDTGLAMAQRTLFERTRIHAAITAPLRGPRGAILGALTLGRADQLHDFTSTELALVDDLARQAGLAIDNARLYERQQRVTETMQRYLLSPLPETVLVKMAVRYHPAPDASHVGGDWYDAFRLQDGTPALVIGDVAGHDLQAASHMAQIRNMLRALAWDRDEPPSSIVSRLDHALGHISEVSMATMVFARLEEDGSEGRRVLRWTNAGHLPPLLVLRDGQARFLDEHHDLLLGAETDIPRTDSAVELPVASTVVFYTDGLIESTRHGLDEGMAQLRQHAAELVHHELDDFCDLLIERVRPEDNDDDVAVIVIRVPESPVIPPSRSSSHTP